MKKNIYLFLSLLLVLFSKQNALAYDFESNGFYYNLNSYDLTVSITFGENNYEGVITIPEEVSYKGKTMPIVSIGESAFKDCSNLSSIQFGENINSIEENAFQNCYKLSRLSIPSNISHIGRNAFYGCSNIKELTVCDSESPLRFGINGTESPSCAFDCKLKYLYIGRTMGYLEWGHVYDLDNSELEIILIGEGVTDIYGFSGSKITQITIPKNVTWIGKGTFKNCINLKSVYFEDSESPLTWQEAYDTTIASRDVSVSPFYDCPIENVYIGRLIKPTTNNIRLGGSEGPFDRTPVKTVSISNSLTSLCGFNYCDNLKEIDIPASVVELSGFLQSASLTSITVKATNPPSVKVYGFENSTYLNAVLYVPFGSKETYKADQIWGKFFDIQDMTDSPIQNNKCETPTISYYKGKLMFTTNTEGAICHSSITNKDVSSYSGNEVQLVVSYIINAYATKPGYENSDVATATLCWIDVDPKTEGITNRIAQVNAKALLIQANDGLITVNGMGEGQRVTIYQVDGKQIATSTADSNGFVSVATNLQRGTFAIVKVGNRSVKMLMQ